MALVYIGTWDGLKAIDADSYSHGDTAHIYYNARSRVFKLFTSGDEASWAEEGTDHPYVIDPTTGTGRWVEQIGNAYDVINGDMIRTGAIESTNWGTTEGSRYDLDNGTITLGGSSSPKFSVTAAGVLTCTGANVSGAITGSTIDIGGADATSFHIDADGNMWLGAATYNIATNPFAVSKAGVLRAVSGSIGGWTLSATELSSTQIKLTPGASAEILLGADVSSYANATIGLKNDGSGKLADGKIVWTTGGDITIGDATRYIKYDGALTIDVDANVGTGVGVIYKDGKRWLYDFNPAHNGTVQPYGRNLFLGVEAGNLDIGSTATTISQSSQNIGIGSRALYALTTGNDNIAIGWSSLLSNTAGYENIAIGRGNLLYNVDGYKNIAIGTSIMEDNEGNNNIGIGITPLQSNVLGDYNIAIGTFALGTLSFGDNNIAIGYNAGVYQSDGINALASPEDSIYIGTDTKSGSDPSGGEDDITNEIVIGYNATGNGSNTITLGNTSIIANYFEGAIYFTELSADPTAPAEGQAVIWMSDGTDSGDDGDIMMKVKAGGSTKTITLVDFSAA